MGGGQWRNQHQHLIERLLRCQPRSMERLRDERGVCLVSLNHVEQLR